MTPNRPASDSRSTTEWRLSHQIPRDSRAAVSGLLDYGGDGWLDVYTESREARFPPDLNALNTGDRLFQKQEGNGHVPRMSPIDTRGSPGCRMRIRPTSVTVGDIDNDGHPDLFLTRWQSYALFRNKGDGAHSRTSPKRPGWESNRDWPTSAAASRISTATATSMILYRLPLPPSGTASTRGLARTRIATYSPFVGRLNFRRCPTISSAMMVGVSSISRPRRESSTGPARGLGLSRPTSTVTGAWTSSLPNSPVSQFLFLNRGGHSALEEVGRTAGVASSAHPGYTRRAWVLASGDSNGDGLPDLAVLPSGEYTAHFTQNPGRRCVQRPFRRYGPRRR